MVLLLFRLPLSTLQLLLILSHMALLSAAVEYVAEGSCTPQQQRNILEAVTGCQARDTLVDLREHMPNASNVIQVIPDFATVKRCGGSCDLHSHRCVPTSTTMKRLEVMVVVSQFPMTRTETECGFVEVEEDVGCVCDCPVKPQDCTADQVYEAGSCKCLCRDQEARNQCVRDGMQWDPVNCLCICPISEWKVCSTGYIFDFTSSCQCVPTSTTASTGLVAAVIVLITCFLITIVGGYVMFKRKMGIFRNFNSNRRNTVVSIPVMEGSAQRTEYDLVKEGLERDHHILEE
jgi:hypothetical protein